MRNGHGYVYNAIVRMGFFGLLFTTILMVFIGPLLWIVFAKTVWRISRKTLIESGMLIAVGYILIVSRSDFGNTYMLAILCGLVTMLIGYVLMFRVLKRHAPTNANTTHEKSIPTENPKLFEQQIAKMFRRYGYDVRLTKYQGDHGIDIKIYKPGEFGIVQCKRYAGSVGEPLLRDFFGAMQHENADVGYFVTTGHFTTAAHLWSRGKKMLLIDGDALNKMLQETGA